MRLEVSFRVLNKNLDVDFSAKDKKLNAEFQCFQRITEQGDVDYYDGSYTVTPKVEEQRGVENYFKKCILDKPIIEDATYMNKTMGRYSFSYLCVSWDKVENATSYKIEVIKNDETSKVYETNKSYFYTSRQDEFIMEGMDGAKVKVRAYGENDTFGVWSEKKEVSGVDSTGGVEVHTVDIPYQGKTERSYFYAQN